MLRAVVTLKVGHPLVYDDNSIENYDVIKAIIDSFLNGTTVVDGIVSITLTKV